MRSVSADIEQESHVGNNQRNYSPPRKVSEISRNCYGSSKKQEFGFCCTFLIDHVVRFF